MFLVDIVSYFAPNVSASVTAYTIVGWVMHVSLDRRHGTLRLGWLIRVNSS